MDNILETIDCEYKSGFPALVEKKYQTIKEESTTSNFGDILDTFVNETPKNDKRGGVFAEFGNLSMAKQDAFHESGLKYLLAKSPIENDSKKSGKTKKEVEEEEREKMQVLVSNFTEEQLDRYEMFRRAAFPKAAIKRIMQVITGNSVSQNVVIAMSGIAKVFVGEIVEEALDIMETQNDIGPLQPKHLREAVRRLRRRGRIPSLRDKKPNYRF